MTTLEQCAKSLRDILQPLGFTRKSSTWRRNLENYIDVIEFQREYDRYTVNVGVLTKGTLEIIWGTPTPAFPKEVKCTVRSRIGRLVSEYDLWWDVSNAISLTIVAEYTRNAALPFLDRMHSTEQQQRFLIDRGALKDTYPLPAMKLAILMFWDGKESEACALLRSLGSKSGLWNPRIAEVAARLNCPKL
jgi:hypothetical protein